MNDGQSADPKKPAGSPTRFMQSLSASPKSDAVLIPKPRSRANTEKEEVKVESVVPVVGSVGMGKRGY